MSMPPLLSGKSSVRGKLSGVAGVTHEMRRIDARLGERACHLPSRSGSEEQVEPAVGNASQPICLDLAFELPGRPARIAEREQSMQWAFAGGDRLQDLDRAR